MLDDSRSSQRREITGFAVSVGFVCLAAVRDVYLGGVFQRITPLLIAIVAFTLCTVVFLPTAIVSSRNSLAILRHRLGDLFWVNITSAIAWITFLYGLKLIEPLVVQILYSGIGPLSVIWIERNLSGGGPRHPDHAWGAARLFGAARHVGLLGFNNLDRALRNDPSVGRQRRPWRHSRHQRRDIDLGEHDAMPEADRRWSHAKRTAFAPLPSHCTQRGGDDVTVAFRTEQRVFFGRCNSSDRPIAHHCAELCESGRDLVGFPPYGPRRSSCWTSVDLLRPVSRGASNGLALFADGRDPLWLGRHLRGDCQTACYPYG
jgi:hypothetical protein